MTNIKMVEVVEKNIGEAEQCGTRVEMTLYRFYVSLFQNITFSTQSTPKTASIFVSTTYQLTGYGLAVTPP